MIFQYSYEKVLAAEKTQTRRIVKPEETAIYHHSQMSTPCGSDDRIVTVKSGSRVKWQVGMAYAAQPGRTQKAVGHIRLKSIRKELLQDVSDGDVRAEGFETREAFHEIWDTVHSKRGRRWGDNPTVWVLAFELVQ
jgi:hypothetical protein